MKFVNALKSFIGAFADRIVVFIFALALSQLPSFMNQYVDALTGAIFESTKIYEDIKSKAALNNKTVDEFIKKHLDNSDLDFRNSGKLMQDAVERYNKYKTAHTAITTASLWAKPFIFVRYVDFSLAKSITYKPALPLSLESLLYVLFGILLGMIFYRYVLAKPLGRLFGPKGANSNGNISGKSSSSKGTPMPEMPTFELSDDFKHLKK